MLDQKMSKANALIKKTKDLIEKMKADNELNESNKHMSNTEIRIQKNIYGILSSRFVELVTDYTELQTKQKQRVQEKFTRQCKIIKPDATDEEIQKVVESGDSEIFSQAMLDSKLHDSAKSALSYIENKHERILHLEQSINELHQLFVDMALLVETQGEIINQIEMNVHSAAEYVKEGNQELVQAVEYQKKSRKKMCIIIIIVVVVCVVLMAILFPSLFSRK